MDNRRPYFTLFLLFAATWFVLAPVLFPNWFPKKKPVPAAATGQKDSAKPADNAVNAQAAPAEVVEHPARTTVLGPDPKDNNPTPDYFLRVTTTTRGAAIVSAELLDPHYTTLDRTQPLKVVGNAVDGAAKPGEERLTLATSMPAIDDQLKAHKSSLDTVDWEVVPGSEGPTGVTYRYVAPDGSIEIRKKYELHKGNVNAPNTDAGGYMLSVEQTIENKGAHAITTRYKLTGPTGIPIEDPDNARTYIELKAGTVENPDDLNDVDATTLSANSLVDETEKAAANNNPAALTVWRRPFRYVGADVQYFAALLVPKENQAIDANGDKRPDSYFSEARPVIVHKDEKHPERSDVSLDLTSSDLDIAAGSSTTHSFDLYLGPKRSHLLESFGAEPVMNYGWLRVISRFLLATLNFFHNSLGAPYWLAIILLTVCVRGLMFPISLKQTAGAQKMKEIQPELAELKKKYSDDPQKFALAQRDVFRKHNYNPLSGCLPILLQMPIFIGLYNALNYSVDLRLAKFLWIDNLAGPDALMRFQGKLPLVGWSEFNLLPLITVGLFLVQQKMFMPPPATEEQRLQNKIMNFMMVFMGFLFYRSPAGLCIYFIASSTWGICERKILDRMKPQLEARAAAKRAKQAQKPPKEGKGWYDRLLEAADEARKQTNGRAPGGTREKEKSDRRR